MPAVEVFFALGTQWRIGMSGATGLDYNAVPAVFELLGVKKPMRRELFDAMRVMEGAALSAWAERRNSPSP